MAGASRSARLALGSLAVVLALTGCAGRSWQFWKSSSTSQDGADTARVVEPTVATAQPVSTASVAPGAAPERAPAAVPAARDFVELTGLGDVLFRPGAMTVSKADARTLDALARWLAENPGAQLLIEGHTDDLGNRSENRAIAHERATSAKNYLVGKGVEPERILVVSHGSDQPVCAEKTTACRAKNRRVHFLVRQP